MKRNDSDLFLFVGYAFTRNAVKAQRRRFWEGLAQICSGFADRVQMIGGLDANTHVGLKPAVKTSDPPEEDPITRIGLEGAEKSVRKRLNSVTSSGWLACSPSTPLRDEMGLPLIGGLGKTRVTELIIS